MHLLQENGVLFAPAKAANAGGVAVSGLEQSQNSLRVSWGREEVDRRLHGIMSEIHRQCAEWGTSNGAVDYVKGANLAGFKRIADAMLAYGTV
jgi:glutamate dehydrogenase (NADP+)